MLTWAAVAAVAGTMILTVTGAAPTPPEPTPPGGGAWANINCESSPGGCDIDTGIVASSAARPTPAPARHGPVGTQPTCTSYPDVEGGVRDYWIAHHGLRTDQRLILRICQPGGPEFLVLPGRPPADAPATNPATVAATARDRLNLPAPILGVSPVGDQLIGLPTWLWIDPATWRRISAAARVPGVTTTATAVPLSVVWAVGDGSTVTCRGAGTVYTAATPPGAASPDCGYVFRSPSPPAGFRMTATVHWSVSWQGAGRAGVFPDLVSTTAVTVHVLRVPAVNVLPGGGQ